MKRLLVLALCLLLVMPAAYAEGGDIVRAATSYTLSEGAKDADGAVMIPNAGNYIGFENVDMTGVQSIAIVADCKITGGENGDTYRVRLGDVKSGECIGYIIVHDTDVKDKTYACNLLHPVSGASKIFLQSSYGYNAEIKIKQVTFSKQAAEEKAPVPDSAIVDNWSDTWQATDALGRKIADYAEAGPVKAGDHKVGMFYWINFAYTGVPKAIVTHATDVIAQYPDAKDDYEHPAWPESQGKSGAYYWGEPLLGYYTSQDYFVYRRHAEMLSDAGVDFVLFDWSNGQIVMWNTLSIFLEAWNDAKASGVDVPKLSCLGPWGGGDTFMQAVYLSIIGDPSIEPLWFKLDGKYLVMNPSRKDSYKPGDDYSMNDIMEDIFEKFTFRSNGYRGSGDEVIAASWNWLQNYPQTKWNKTSDGRTECVPVGTAINHSYEYEYKNTGVFSDPYTKGRAYSEAFGDDYRPEAKRIGYFFREQQSRALAVDPAIVLLDGWNEWQNGRHKGYADFPNAFVDTFSEERSRDVEPSGGVLGDDYYMATVDFIRKYKGVRPAPEASSPKTIDLSGDISQWADVAPEYYNVGGRYERDAYGFVDPATEQNFHYVTKSVNVITGAKVARDDTNVYFMVQCDRAIEKNNSFMHLYIDVDRNRATGWEGYDLSVNVAGEGALAQAGYAGSWVKAADVSQTIVGDSLMVAVPRSFFGTGAMDFEFKWADGAEENGDILRFYEFGTVAPKGRFNYLYTEKAQTTLDQDTRAKLSDTAVLKAGSSKMNVSGGMMYLDEADTRVTAFEENGVLYVPAFAAEDILGFGETKVEYYSDLNRIFVKNFNLGLTKEPVADYRGTKSIRAEVQDYIWSSCIIGDFEVRVNGKAGHLSAPVMLKDGVPYLPLSYFAEVFGWTYQSLGDGLYAVSSHAVDASAAQLAASYLN